MSIKFDKEDIFRVCPNPIIGHLYLTKWWTVYLIGKRKGIIKIGYIGFSNRDCAYARDGEFLSGEISGSKINLHKLDNIVSSHIFYNYGWRTKITVQEASYYQINLLSP